jgi:CheY-like chemotaxis protein
MGTELVLIVEDDGAVRRLVRDILELAGYQVLTAADGREALRSCQQHSGAIALILTDVTMPRMGGQELSEQVQHLDPGVRILFTSGHAADDMVQRGRAIPRDRFIRKPFSARSLAYKVREVLDERPACCP